MTVPGLAGQYAEQPHHYPQHTDGYHPEHAQGWITFAGVLLGVVGVVNIIYGIARISDSNYFDRSTHNLLLTNLHTQGWAFLILGVIEVTAAVSVMRGHTYGAVAGIILAALNMFGSLFTVRANTGWALVVIVIDLLIIYALAVYGGRGTRTETG